MELAVFDRWGICDTPFEIHHFRAIEVLNDVALAGILSAHALDDRPDLALIPTHLDMDLSGGSRGLLNVGRAGEGNLTLARDAHEVCILALHRGRGHGQVRYLA